MPLLLTQIFLGSLPGASEIDELKAAVWKRHRKKPVPSNDINVRSVDTDDSWQVRRGHHEIAMKTASATTLQPALMLVAETAIWAR
jgi:hypothetical protein